MRVFSPCPTRLHTPNAAMIAALFALPLAKFCSTLFVKPKLQEFTAVRDKILYSSSFDSVQRRSRDIHRQRTVSFRNQYGKDEMIDLYTYGTPNGLKASIGLEEFGLPYTVHTVDIMKNEQLTPEFLRIGPNNRIPVIVDRDTGMSLMESGAILIYLADKTGRLLPKAGEPRYRAIEWLMWQMGGEGPMLSQVHHFVKFNKGKALSATIAAGSRGCRGHSPDLTPAQQRRQLGELAAMRRASSRVGRCAAARRPGSSSK
jgi:glutathione S-transferase